MKVSVERAALLFIGLGMLLAGCALWPVAAGLNLVWTKKRAIVLGAAIVLGVALSILVLRVYAQGPVVPVPVAFTDPRPLRERVAGLGPVMKREIGALSAPATDTFWAYDFYLGTDYLITATLRYTGTHSYVYVDNVETVSDTTVISVAVAFDGIFATTTAAFGDVPDVDGEERIFILLTDIQDVYAHDPNATSYVACYFDPLHEYPGEPYSNGKEMLFLDLDPGDPVSMDADRGLAHQLELMIGFNYDPYEEYWFDEGMGSLAEYINGYGHRPEIEDYLDYPERPLTGWTGHPQDVGESYLWALYIYEHYFGQAGVQSILHSPLHGMDAVSPTLGVSAKVLFHRWALANYLDDGSQAGGIYGYSSITITTGTPDGVTSFSRPQPITYIIPQDDWVISGTMPAYWGVRYYELYRASGSVPMKIGTGFDGQSTAVNGQVVHFDWSREIEVNPFGTGDVALLAVLPGRSTGLLNYKYTGSGLLRIYLPIITKDYGG